MQRSSRQGRWQQFLSRFHSEWEYCKGCCNIDDPVSRCPSLHALAAEESGTDDGDVSGSVCVSAHILQRMCGGYASDPYLSDEHDTSAYTFVRGGCRKDQIILVPDVGDLGQPCLSLHHYTPYATHLGVDRTAHLVNRPIGGSFLTVT